MKATLADLVAVRSGFARSASIERDAASLNPAYVPTGRAREVIRRIALGVQRPSLGRSFSITGTYGSGKSSLALFASALFGPEGRLHQGASATLAAVDPDLSALVEQVRASHASDGLLMATVTANREPVTVTIARALASAVDGAKIPAKVERAVRALACEPEPSGQQVMSAIRSLNEHRGLLLLIDEFGKNIEEFVRSGEAQADLFVLQEIAEWASGDTRHPVVLVLLQHLAFADYDRHGSSSREWAKVQGRFTDIPYAESPAESQALMASVFEVTGPLDGWVDVHKRASDEAGLADLIHVPLVEVFPLHPVTAIVLPGLCYRYGQNERTLFAFLAGPDAAAVPELLQELPAMPRAEELPAVRLHHVYDYFLSSAPSMVSASPHASRWIEIETRLRDAVGLMPHELRVLKAIAVLNLVSAGGACRASRAVLRYAAADGSEGTPDAASVDSVLSSLQERGFVTYREFSDEFRVWEGTDYDFEQAIEAARRSLSGLSVAHLVNTARPQAPVVASRHSQHTGVLRVFDRLFVDASSPAMATELGQDFDGLVLLCLGQDLDVLDRQDVRTIAAARPVVLGLAKEGAAVTDATLELAALQHALRSAEASGADWVAVRELRERVAAAAAKLDAVIDDLNSGSAIAWKRLSDGKATAIPRAGSRPLPGVLSALCDDLYPQTPLLRNEMLSRRVLTSQGAKARRNLLEAMLAAPDQERCSLEGFPPERAMYEAVLGSTGIHRTRHGERTFGQPPASDPLNYGPTWALIEECFKDASGRRLPMQGVYLRLMQPPIGLKEGPLPILLVAALIAHADEVAIYENDSFVPRLDIAVVERMIRNPDMFALQSYSLRGPRRHLAAAIVERLNASSTTPRHTRLPSVVTAVGPLLSRVRSLPEHALKTTAISARTAALRQQLLTAREPDTLLFKSIPEALGHRAVGAKESAGDAIETIVSDLFRSMAELEAAHDKVLARVENTVRDCLRVTGSAVRDEIRARFGPLRDRAGGSEDAALLGALVDQFLDHDDWLAYLGMVVSGRTTQTWTDKDVETGLSRLQQALSRIRNLEDLPAEDEPGYQSVRIGWSQVAFGEQHRVVRLAERQRPGLRAIAQSAIERARQDFGTSADEALLAEMLFALMESDRTVASSTGRPRKPTKKGR